ncbi:MAG: hypothetical protein HXY25_02430 [Alphaproteobacteria bacterium]|nr:hypothetical protein [Alphaproteobacteria bacterium]
MPFVLLLIALALTLAGLALWQASDVRADRRAMDRLRARQPAAPARFDPALVASLPEPARRYFTFAIAPGTPLRTVAEIHMTGRFRLGSGEAARDLAMRAHQVLGAPEGFVWRMAARRGVLCLSGSDGLADGTSWTRFRMLGLFPLAHLGGTEDHGRSAFGRLAAEAVFWTPAAVLPGPGVTWEPVDDDTARVTLSHAGLPQSVDVTVDAEGRPVRVVFPRWSDADPERTYRLQPFGGDLSAFRDFGGFRLPTHVEAGNFYGTAAYAPFFLVDVTEVTFPASGPAAR